VNLLTPDALQAELSFRTGEFLLLYFRTGLPKNGIRCAKFVFSDCALSRGSLVLAPNPGFRRNHGRHPGCIQGVAAEWCAVGASWRIIRVGYL
jgi:hypothetical protein